MVRDVIYGLPACRKDLIQERFDVNVNQLVVTVLERSEAYMEQQLGLEPIGKIGMSYLVYQPAGRHVDLVKV